MEISRRLRLTATIALFCLSLAMLCHGQQVEEIKKLIDDGWWADAVALAQAKIKQYPDNSEINFLLGKACFLTGDYDDAEDYLDEAIKLGENGSDRSALSQYHYWLANTKGIKAQKGGILKAPGRAKACKSNYEKAIALEPENLEARFGLLQYHMQAPGFVGGDRDKARAQADTIGYFDKIQGLKAQSMVAEFIDEEYPKAEDYLKQAMAMDTTNLDSYYWLGHFLARRERLDEAESLSFKAQAVDSTDLNIYYSRASIYERQQRYDKALTEYETIQRKDSTDLLASYQIAKTLILADKELGRAESLLTKYIGARHKGYWPDEAAARWRLAMVYDRQGRTTEAIQELEQGLTLKPRRSEKEMKEMLKDLKKKS